MDIKHKYLRMEECMICGEKTNKSSRLKTSCCYCDFDACRSCWQTWFLSETTQRCMSPNCDKEWTRKHLAQTMTKTFIANDLKKHRENILYDKERALFPATQIIIEKQKQIDELSKQNYELEIQIRRLRQKQNEIYERQRQLRSEIGKGSRERSEFVRACPDENCRGFLSSQWKCGLCEKWTCPDCHEIKGLHRDCEHTCDPNNVETAKLLSKDTKPCPNCGYGIFKIDGCDQMWCTQCHVAFSFRTGRIENNIHNPHYYEYMRQNGGMPRNPLDNPCGQEIDHGFINNMLRGIRLFYYLDPIESDLYHCSRNIIHIRYVTIPENEVDPYLKNQDLRIQYMKNQISEDEYKMKIQRNDKKHQKMIENRNVFNLIVTTVTDILYRFINALERRSREDQISTLKEINVLSSYVKEVFEDIGQTYNCKPLNADYYVRRIRYWRIHGYVEEIDS